jgi:hypothetical protein
MSSIITFTYYSKWNHDNSTTQFSSSSSFPHGFFTSYKLTVIQLAEGQTWLVSFLKVRTKTFKKTPVRTSTKIGHPSSSYNWNTKECWRSSEPLLDVHEFLSSSVFTTYGLTPHFFLFLGPQTCYVHVPNRGHNRKSSLTKTNPTKFSLTKLLRLRSNNNI